MHKKFAAQFLIVLIAATSLISFTAHSFELSMLNSVNYIVSPLADTTSAKVGPLVKKYGAEQKIGLFYYLTDASELSVLGVQCFENASIPAQWICSEVCISSVITSEQQCADAAIYSVEKILSEKH